MRAGWIISFVGHVGAALMSLLAWEATSTPPPEQGSVVPVEIVTLGPESNVRALTMPDDQTSDDPTSRDEHEDPTPTPAPTPTPVPTPKPPTPRSSNFDLADISHDIDRQRRETHQRNSGQTSDHSQQGVGLGTAEVATMQDRIRSIISRALGRCWDDVRDLPDPDRLVVNVSWEVDRSGHLRGQPVVTSPRNYQFDQPMRTAVDRAMRAIRRCDPLPLADDPIVGQHYELWRNGDFTFRTKD